MAKSFRFTHPETGGEVEGEIDQDGRIYTNTGIWGSREEFGRIEDGRIYQTKDRFFREEIGRIEGDTVYDTRPFFREEALRVEDGRIYDVRGIVRNKVGTINDTTSPPSSEDSNPRSGGHEHGATGGCQSDGSGNFDTNASTGRGPLSASSTIVRDHRAIRRDHRRDHRGRS